MSLRSQAHLTTEGETLERAFALCLCNQPCTGEPETTIGQQDNIQDE